MDIDPPGKMDTDRARMDIDPPGKMDTNFNHGNHGYSYGLVQGIMCGIQSLIPISPQVFNFAIYEGLKVAPPTQIINRLILTKIGEQTQFQLNRLWNAVPCDIATLYAVLLQSVALCLIYAPMYPPFYLITAFVLIATW